MGGDGWMDDGSSFVMYSTLHPGKQAKHSKTKQALPLLTTLFLYCTVYHID